MSLTFSRAPVGTASKSDIFPTALGPQSAPFLLKSSAVSSSPTPLSQPRRSLWLLARIVIVLALLAGLGLRQPNPPDEPRFVLAAKTMVETGNWLLPHRGVELYAEKPPVFMWLQAASYELTHSWKLAFLLPSLLAALLTLWLTWDLGRRLWNRQVAQLAVLALFTTLQFGLMAKRAQIDMVLVAMTTLALWGLLRHLLQGPNWKAWAVGAFAAGVGTVTKGVGFLPLLLLLPWAAWRMRHHPAKAAASGGWGLAWALPAFIAGTAVWLLPLAIALLRDPEPALLNYAHELLFKQTGTRYANAWHHIKPFWYYLQVMATLWLPSCLLLPWLLPAWWRRLRRGDGRQWLLLGWSLLVLIFFSASPGKREVYLLPMLPALSLAAAPLLAGLLRRAGPKRMLAGWVWLASLLMLALGVLVKSGSSLLAHNHFAQSMPSAAIQQLGSGVLIIGAGGLALAIWARLRHPGSAAVAFSALLWCVHGLVLMPALDPYSSASAVMQKVAQRIGPDAELGMVAWREQNLLQADRSALDFGFKQTNAVQWQRASAWIAEAPQQRWLLVLKQAMSPCVDPAKVIDIGQANSNQWQLLPGTALRPDCVTPDAPALELDNED